MPSRSRTTEPSSRPGFPPEESLQLLLAGNERFVAGAAQSQFVTARRAELAAGQRPFAIVLGCADSRVPVETIFDQEPGNIFVVRLAGGIVGESVLGSIEYAVAAFHSSVIVVLGHTQCGAVTAAIEYVRTGIAQPGHIQHLVDAIEPAAREAERGHGGSWIDRAVAANVQRNADQLRSTSEIVERTVRKGKLLVAGAVYDLRSGRVTLINRAP